MSSRTEAAFTVAAFGVAEELLQAMQQDTVAGERPLIGPGPGVAGVITPQGGSLVAVLYRHLRCTA